MGTIADKLKKLNDTKLAIKTAIENKGVANVSDVFATYPSKIMEITTGGGGSTTYDWSKIGYESEPESIGRAYNHSLKIANEWNPATTNASSMFRKDAELRYFPVLDMSNVTKLQATFENSFYLEMVKNLNLPKCTMLKGIFHMCNSLKEVGNITAPECTDMSSGFYGCSNLKNLGKIIIPNCTTINDIFSGCYELQKVEIQCDNLVTADRFAQYANKLNDITLLNIGKNPKAFNIDLSSATLWGNTPESLPSLKNSMASLFDRKSAGLNLAYIRLYREVMSRLTEEEKLAVESKGYDLIV